MLLYHRDNDGVAIGLIPPSHTLQSITVSVAMARQVTWKGYLASRALRKDITIIQEQLQHRVLAQRPERKVIHAKYCLCAASLDVSTEQADSGTRL